MPLWFKNLFQMNFCFLQSDSVNFDLLILLFDLSYSSQLFEFKFLFKLFVNLVFT